MAEVEQKRKKNSEVDIDIQAVIKFSQTSNLPNSKPDSEDLRILESSTGWSNPNISTKILPTRHSRSKQDRPSAHSLSLSAHSLTHSLHFTSPPTPEDTFPVPGLRGHFMLLYGTDGGGIMYSWKRIYVTTTLRDNERTNE